jgi:hypothetical protein
VEDQVERKDCVSPRWDGCLGDDGRDRLVYYIGGVKFVFVTDDRVPPGYFLPIELYARCTDGLEDYSESGGLEQLSLDSGGEDR